MARRTSGERAQENQGKNTIEEEIKMKWFPVGYSWTKARVKKRIAFSIKKHPIKAKKYHMKIVPKFSVGKAHRKAYVVYMAKKR